MNNALDLVILDSGTPNRAIAYGRYRDDTAIEFVPFQVIKALKAFRDRIQKAAAGLASRPTDDELIFFGRDLFAFALPNSLLALYNRLPAESISIQILSNQADFQALPWEYLQEPQGPGGPINTRGVVRIVPTLGKATPAPRKLANKIRILFAYADPSDQGPVEWDEVEAKIRSEFTARLAKNFEIDIVEAATVERLTAALFAKPYDIFHFNGHGEVVVDKNGNEEGHLVLVEEKTRKSQRLSASQLAVLVTGRNLQLVILSACNSAAGDFAKSYAVVARGMVDRGVPAVVANQFPVTNSVAATFVHGLYANLLRTGEIDQAVAEGRVYLAVQPRIGKQAPIEWGIPTLYRHVGANRIFET
jgi:hypothetical protein